LWEAFLLQMNDFDQFLEHGLRQMLDPVVGTQPPRRTTQETPILALEAPVGLVAEAITVEPSVVILPIHSSPKP
jgi:hypothetical protein